MLDHQWIAAVFGTAPVVAGFDCTGSNEPSAPKGAQLAGYDTGSGGIPWTPAQYAAHPGTIHIDQDPDARDPAADILDVEEGAATTADCPTWSRRAQADFDAGTRPGQRRPGIYTSAANVTAVVDALIRGGVTSGVGLWVANWNLSEAQAIRDVQAAAGPFPIIGVQYGTGTWGDFDVWAHGWLTTISGTFATNPVSGLHQTRRGYTSVDLAWDAASHAEGYTVKAFWRGALKRKVQVTGPAARVGRLLPVHTYTFTVRAHPGGSTGADASVKVTTR